MPSLQKLRYSKKRGQEWQPEVQSPMEKNRFLHVWILEISKRYLSQQIY